MSEPLDEQQRQQLSRKLKMSINSEKRRVRDGGSLDKMYEAGAKINSDLPISKFPDDCLKERRAFTGHYGHIYALDWMGDNEHFVSAAQDGNLIVWNACNGFKTAQFRLQSAFIMAAAADKHSRNHVAAGGLDHLVSIYAVSRCQNYMRTTTSASPSRSASSAGGAGACDDDDDAATGGSGSSSSKSTGMGGLERESSRDSEGSRLSTISMKRKKLSERIGGRGGFDQPLQVLHGHEGFISGLSYTHDGRHILTASDDKIAGLWDVDTGVCLETYHGHSEGLSCLALSPVNDNLFATGSGDTTVKIWDRRLRATGGAEGFSSASASAQQDHVGCVQSFTKNTTDVESLAWFPDGNALATGSKDSACRVYDMRCCGQLAQYTGSSVRTPCRALEFSASGRFLIAGYGDSKLRVFDLSLSNAQCNANPVTTLAGHTREVRSIKRSDDGTAFVSGGMGNVIRLHA